MCLLPGIVLRSGLVFQRVTALSMPGQGIGDGDVPASVVRLAGVLRKVDLSGNRLTAVPPGLLGLGAGLEDLNLGNNDIAEMPPEIAKLGGLLFFNMAGNRLTRLPAEIGRLSSLKRLGLKGNALVRLPSSIGDLTHLVELYLTGNILEALPDEIVKLRRLKKLQLSFNNLRSLPQGMEAMRSLELCRLAVNPGLTVVPEGLTYAEKLAWVSLAGSAWCARASEKRRRTSFPEIPREEVVLGERLGSGASGEVFAGVYRGRDVAVKVFKADIGPDGNARDELDVALTVDHPNLTKSLGVVHASSTKPSGRSSSGSESEVATAAAAAAAAAAAGGVPEGAVGGGGGGGSDGIENLRWLVMERVVGRPLAEKPDFSSVLRCRWGSGRRFEPVLVLAVLLQVARAMSYLHEKAICHGDLYAHNVLVDGETGAAVLCDFGASFFYPTDRQHDCSMLEGTEVRAFGLMSKDMACRSAGCEWILQDLVPSCLQSDASHRPSFHEGGVRGGPREAARQAGRGDGGHCR
ncbi:Putative Leucine Rich Repeat Protein Kinase [Ectocarpus siliculosus]|uniref:Leucine Rich Repeat Protein Kinase n=1 Tax=Ectocarpus siliculosus TaxID=2880 RepID=D7FJA1_ECTSI|nr:Putative Leucine Rich Repeat Protein Kinase [Ectocarpus siliculosus]|eukprot:CBJ29007.1 Putative Leucine Rich Repeat Protein Kinase [Ectocarpus siliculosus]